ncbi:anti-sigma factor [Noviherbaspirillum sp. CPCC 100848]|uniref:Anti-sigma factor n=1 Tax=Noviherbaspirillum album TaxID=3080276 RepID=A0ABU6J291_9BURK|nr:anti-sigma factor [Noviherbaspirillum sp. CPCC 100848]MEC4717740.1 anti-sigma factor [Noviherbaspirillum sp. CPCC 100848]
MNFRDQDEVVAVAGEYVLGALSSEEMAEVEQEIGRNHALAAAVGYWRDRLLEVTPAPPPVMPAPRLWARIERDIRQALPAPRAPASGLWNSLFFWRASGMAGVLASALLALRLFTAAPEALTPRYVAVLQPPASGAVWVVAIDAKEVHLRPLSPVQLEAGRSVQFWTKPEGAAAPTSLGLVAADRPTSVPLSMLPGLGPNQLFEVTLEPQSGSPTGRPTGPILAVGTAAPL